MDPDRILRLRSHVTFRTPNGTLAGVVVGRAFGEPPNYDIAVGVRIYANVADDLIVRRPGIVVRFRPRRLP